MADRSDAASTEGLLDEMSLSRTSGRAIVPLLMAIALVSHFNRVSIATAGDTRIMAQYGISPTRMGVVYSAFLFTYTLFMIPGGLFIDRFGVRVALMTVCFGSAVFVALTGAVGLVLTQCSLRLRRPSPRARPDGNALRAAAPGMCAGRGNLGASQGEIADQWHGQRLGARRYRGHAALFRSLDRLVRLAIRFHDHGGASPRFWRLSGPHLPRMDRSPWKSRKRSPCLPRRGMPCSGTRASCC